MTDLCCTYLFFFVDDDKQRHGSLHTTKQSHLILYQSTLNTQHYLDTSERIEAHNNKEPKPSYLLGHNEFSDMTQDEFAKQFNLGQYSNAEFAKLSAQERISSNHQMMDHRFLLQDRPEEVNWVAMGGVTPVKNQV